MTVEMDPSQLIPPDLVPELSNRLVAAAWAKARQLPRHMETEQHGHPPSVVASATQAKLQTRTSPRVVPFKTVCPSAASSSFSKTRPAEAHWSSSAEDKSGAEGRGKRQMDDGRKPSATYKSWQRTSVFTFRERRYAGRDRGGAAERCRGLLE